MKYFIFDLDYTLLNSKGCISDFSLDGINKLKNKGFLVVINTARSLLSALPYIKAINPDYCILNGGVEIFNSKLELVYSNYLNKELINYLINIIKEDKACFDFSIQSSKYLYTNNLSYIGNNPNIAKYYNFKTSFNYEVCKILISIENKHKYAKICNELNLDFTIYNDTNWCRICTSEKSIGNKRLYNYLNDTNPIDYVFGDDLGDIKMIKNAYHGVIMKNAKASLKDDLLVSEFDNDNDGVLKHMELINEL